ncbi:glycosyltransferase [Allobranchiibius sp. GilTou73]|uniref:glycosyltransferase n=1 Tax=Allobranchiibius sp. GilTou73 TaxID=2904523 RepID=UPI001F2C7573|nr:glycosyltransferase [Allobranchiibius sp. GilTou73]UIJ35556.1 glycosyltransferase [Allobranchiibius sp. GilTou73]
MATTPERTLPLVSIIVPCFNAGDTLPETLESARAVGYPSVEIIVCDDGSTDPLTLQVLSELGDDVRVVRQENAGLAAARNAAIAAARGAYVFPLDADDKIHPDYARAAVEVFEADPQVGIVHARVLRFGDAEGEVGYDDFSIGKLLNHNMIHQLSWFRRADWETLGGYDEKLRDGREDHEFWIRIVSTGRTVVKLDELYSIYRIRATSMNHTMTHDKLARIYAEIFRNNSGFYLEHLEEYFTERYAERARLAHWSLRYGKVDALIEGHPRAYGAVRRVAATARRLRRH